MPATGPFCRSSARSCLALPCSKQFYDDSASTFCIILLLLVLFIDYGSESSPPLLCHHYFSTFSLLLPWCWLQYPWLASDAFCLSQVFSLQSSMFLVFSSPNSTMWPPVAQYCLKGPEDLLWKGGALKITEGWVGPGVYITEHSFFCNLSGIWCTILRIMQWHGIKCIKNMHILYS